MKETLAPVALGQLLAWSGGELANSAPDKARAVVVTAVGDLKSSAPGDLAFYFSAQFREDLASARASVLITGSKWLEDVKSRGARLWEGAVVIAAPDPYLAMARVSRELDAFWYGPPARPSPRPEVHPMAFVDPTAKLEDGVTVGAFSFVGPRARVGRGSQIRTGCSIGAEVQIGRDCLLMDRVTLYDRVSLGDRVRIHSSSVIGSDGFGYAPRSEAGQVVEHVKIHHLGSVVIEDDVEIGACTSVDRGTVGNTRIGRGTKIDNQVQIGHNADIGLGVIICGAVGIAGSVRVENFVTLAGGVGLANGAEIGERALVAAFSGLSSRVKAGDRVAGYPARSLEDFKRAHALMSRMLREDAKKRQKSDPEV